MLTRSQLLILTIMATLGGSFSGFLAVGIAMGDITLALINLGVIVALFSCALVIGSGSGEGPSKKRVGDIHVGGELNPEFRTSLSQMIAAQKESGTA